jgi:hypothetical protein
MTHQLTGTPHVYMCPIPATSVRNFTLALLAEVWFSTISRSSIPTSKAINVGLGDAL